METVQLPYPVPYAGQVASPELAHRILEGLLPAEQDPRWAEVGAGSPQEYAYWVERACGVACVKMCVEAMGGPRRTLVEWARAGVSIHGYLIVTEENGLQSERGWIHQSLADLCRAEGLQAEPRPAKLEEFLTFLRSGQMVIASVSYEIGVDGPITRRSGHLVVVTGAELEDGHLSALRINNPSGRTPEMRANARIPVERFMQGYSGRVILVWR